MSLWESITGVFTGDTFFPDNPLRQHRLEELGNDCAHVLGTLRLLTPRIQEELAKLNSAISDLFQHAIEPEEAKVQTFEFAGWAVEASRIIAPLLVTPAVTAALNVGATTYLLGTGEIGAAAFAELVGLPAALEIGIGAVAGVFAVGAVVGIGAIAGVMKRDQLQDAIHGAVAARLQLQKAYATNSRLLNSIQSITASLAVFKERGLLSDEMICSLKEGIKKAQKALVVTDEEVEAYLNQFDNMRQSWTEEDH